MTEAKIPKPAEAKTPPTFEEQLKALLEKHPAFDPATVAKIATQKKNADNAKIKKEKIREAKELIEEFRISHNAVFPSKPWKATSAETLILLIKEQKEAFANTYGWKEESFPEDFKKVLAIFDSVEQAIKTLDTVEAAIGAFGALESKKTSKATPTPTK